MNKAIVWATPVFLLLIAIEFAWGWLRGRNTYRLGDAIASISLGMLSQLAGVYLTLLRIGVYTLIWEVLALAPDSTFWQSWPGWLAALLLYDFCYYWHHRAGHEVALFWAAHVVHHQSQSYNLSTALRQTGSGLLLGWIFYVPMALLGVPPVLLAIVGLVDLLYQFWVHTEHVPKLGWFDRWFCSPSNHRVHHAVNDRYLDRNYGGLLVVWDRAFGTFVEEDAAEPCVYGTRMTLRSYDPLWANLEVYATLLRDSWATRRWSDKIRVWLRPAAWRPADVAARWPRPVFDLAAQQVFDPPLSPRLQLFAVLQFSALLGAVAGFLWFAETLTPTNSLLAGAAITMGLWALNATLQGRIGWVACLVIDAATLSTLGAAADWVELHQAFKPLTMLLMMAWVLMRLLAVGGVTRRAVWLLLALGASCVGDVLLMLRGQFVAGLIAFLCAHLAYIALFRSDAATLAHRRAVMGTLAAGLTMYGVLIAGGLPAELRVPVAVYVLVISLMAAQAIGRAAAMPGETSRRAAWGVALGALLFMLSDTLLAINRFVTPLPLSSLWVLTTYYAAQFMIVRHMLPALAEAAARPTH
ncbi:MAG: sterol desaturase family protein [Burkholderiales bacterium]|nr:sterol desaturase family protein [Burkholderiales bacterium]